MEYKNIQGGIIDVDDASFRVKVAFNKVGVKDYDNDVIDEKAFDKTIKERGKSGSDLIYHLIDHDPSFTKTLGKPHEMGIENGYLYAVTNIVQTSIGQDMMKHYMAGTVNQHSVGFKTVRKTEEKDGEGPYSLIKEIKLFEGSAVLWGANPNTPTFSVGKSYTKKQLDDELDVTVKELEKFTSLFRKGTLTDESFGLVEIKMNQLADKIRTLFNLQATQADEKSLAPDGEKSAMDQLTEFTNLLKVNQWTLHNNLQS